MESLFLAYITLWKPLGYGLVFLGVMFEGDVFLLMTAGLTRFGYFDPLSMLVVVCAGVIIGDLVWFSAGRRLKYVDTVFTRWVMRHVSKLPTQSDARLFVRLLASKFMYGTHHPFLFALGATGISVKDFLRREIAAAPIWVLIIGNLGYWSASMLVRVKHIFKYAELGILVIVLVYITVIMTLEKRKGSATNVSSTQD